MSQRGDGGFGMRTRNGAEIDPATGVEIDIPALPPDPRASQLARHAMAMGALTAFETLGLIVYFLITGRAELWLDVFPVFSAVAAIAAWTLSRE